MIEKIELGECYAIYTLPLFGSLKQNVKIIGKTDADNVSNNLGDYNLFNTYFESIGLGLTTYYTTVQKDTTIYICLLLSSINPFEVSEEKVFIPESIIDFEVSDKYVKASNFFFNIYPLLRRFDTDDEKDSFMKQIKDKILDRINGIIEFSVIDKELEIQSIDQYMLDSEISEIEKTRKIAYDNYYSRLKKENELDLIKENEYNLLLNQVKDEKQKYIELQKELEKKIKQYDNILNSLSSNG